MTATLAKRLRNVERAVITANRLRDGAVIWRGSDGSWTIHFADAAIYDAGDVPTALDAAKRDEAARLVVGSYVAPVSTSALGANPTGWKERIRANGPTIAVPGGLHGQA